MARRKTDDEFKNEMAELRPSIKIDGQYKNCNTKLHCYCTIHNYEWDATPTIIRLHGCPVCSGHIITSDVYKERLKKVHGDKITLISGYVNMSTKCIHHCNKHNIDFSVVPYATLKGQECRLCMKEKLRDAALTSEENALKKLYDMYGDEYELYDQYHGVSERHRFIHHLDGGTSHEFTTSFSLLFLGQGCGVCSNNQILVGYNDIATTNPAIASLFANEKDTHRYVELSNQSVDFKCPDCGNTVKRVIATVVKNNGISCPHCSDGISYPNKLIYNCMKQIENNFDFLEREYKPKWCKFYLKGKEKRGYYDIFFGVNGKKYIIEMDGGLGHGHQNKKARVSQEDCIFIDNQKDLLAERHNINVIRIDSYYEHVENRYEFIKNNIIQSLQEIIEIKNIDFDKANINSLQSLFIKSCGLWNHGLSVREISDSISIHHSTVRSYLVSGNKYGLCDYSKEKNNIRCNKTREIVLLNTGEHFCSIKDAGDKYSIHPSSIQECCSGKTNYSGQVDGSNLIWVYVDDYIKMSHTDIQNKIVDSYIKKVVCIETSILYANVKDASSTLDVTPSAVQKCCLGQSKSCCQLHWTYYENYIQNNDASTLIPYGRLSA